MRIGILGTGSMGKTHANIFKAFPEVKLHGIVGRNQLNTVEIANSLETLIILLK